VQENDRGKQSRPTGLTAARSKELKRMRDRRYREKHREVIRERNRKRNADPEYRVALARRLLSITTIIPA
jgi:hypothetical protein